LAQAQEVVDLGHFVSFSGVVTFENASEVREAAKSVPIERIMVETNAPHFAPAPNRTKRCEPAFIRETAAFIANLRGMSLAAFAAQTYPKRSGILRIQHVGSDYLDPSRVPPLSFRPAFNSSPVIASCYVRSSCDVRRKVMTSSRLNMPITRLSLVTGSTANISSIESSFAGAGAQKGSSSAYKITRISLVPLIGEQF
jgi:hypothetical protein